ncbi:MAG: SCO family protein [Rhodospirillaceae bacterium]|nr:SCO family protein [Rhodospirillaceae bacterium]
MLQAHDGKVMTDQDFRGRFMLITFGYTWCPDVCPMALSTMSEALEELGKDAEKVVPVFVSVDPKRDTVSRLDAYVEHFHPRLVGLTGPKPMIDKTAERYKVKYAMVADKDGDPDGYTVDHTASVYLMGPHGEFRVKFMYNIDPEAMAARIREALAE